MNREYHLTFCKVCNHQNFDPTKGIVCELTNKIADFEKTCENYIENPELKNKIETSTRENFIVNKTASQYKRFINHIIDLIFMYLFAFAFAFTLGIIISIFSPNSAYIFETSAFGYVIAFIAGMVYFLFFEGVFGRSIGKFVTKTKVVDEFGNKPTFQTIFIRSLCRFIPFDAFSFLFGENGGWHDTISNTTVIEN